MAHSNRSIVYRVSISFIVCIVFVALIVFMVFIASGQICVGAQLPLSGHNAARWAERSFWGRLPLCGQNAASNQKAAQGGGENAAFGSERRARGEASPSGQFCIVAQLPLSGQNCRYVGRVMLSGPIAALWAECSIRRGKQLSGQNADFGSERRVRGQVSPSGHICTFGQEWCVRAIQGFELAARGDIAQLLHRWLK